MSLINPNLKHIFHGLHIGIPECINASDFEKIMAEALDMKIAEANAKKWVVQSTTTEVHQDPAFHLMGSVYEEMMNSNPEKLGQPLEVVELCTVGLISPQFDPGSTIKWQHPDIQAEDLPTDPKYQFLKVRQYCCQNCGKVWRVNHDTLDSLGPFELEEYLSCIHPYKDPS